MSHGDDEFIFDDGYKYKVYLRLYHSNEKIDAGSFSISYLDAVYDEFRKRNIEVVSGDKRDVCSVIGSQWTIYDDELVFEILLED